MFYHQTGKESSSNAAANQRFGKKCNSFIPPHFKFTVQPKLAINQPKDIYEQEADRIAEHVVGMPDVASSSVQRTNASNEGIQLANNDLETQLGISKGTGVPMPDDIRSFMEPRFGADFSDVQIHTDNEADDMNRQVNAYAFTHNQHIYFRAGKYNPESSEGKQLLAHELTHVVQQSLGPLKGMPAEGAGIAVNDPSDHFERAADQVAVEGASTHTGMGMPVQRQEAEGESLWDTIASGSVPFVGQGIDALAEGLGASGLGGAALGPVGIIRGIQEGGFRGAAEATAGGLETVGGLAELALPALAEGGTAAGAAEGLASLGPVGAVMGAGLGGAALGTYIAENTGVDEAIGDTLFDVLGPEPGLWLADTFGL